MPATIEGMDQASFDATVLQLQSIVLEGPVVPGQQASRGQALAGRGIGELFMDFPVLGEDFLARQRVAYEAGTTLLEQHMLAQGDVVRQ